MAEITPAQVAAPAALRGPAFVLPVNNQPLDILLKGEAYRQRLAQLQEAARAKAAEALSKESQLAIKAVPDGVGPVYQNRWTTQAAPAYGKQLEELYRTEKDPVQLRIKAAKVQQDAQLDQKLHEQAGVDYTARTKRLLTDKYLNGQVAADRLHETMLNENGQTIDPRTINLDEAEQVVLNSRGIVNAPEVYKDVLGDVLKRDTQAITTAARPGGTGTSTSITTDLYNPVVKNGQVDVERDTKGNPVVDMDRFEKVFPQMEKNVYFKRAVDDAVQDYEELRATDTLRYPPKSRAEIAADAVSGMGGVTVRKSETYRNPLRASAGSRAATAKFAVTGNGDVADDKLAVTLNGKEAAYTRAGQVRVRVKSNGDTEPLTARLPLGSYNIQEPGKKLAHISNDPAPQSVTVNRPVLLLVSTKSGSVSTPPASIKTQADLEAWMTQERARPGHEHFEPMWAAEIFATKGSQGAVPYDEALKQEIAFQSALEKAHKGDDTKFKEWKVKNPNADPAQLAQAEKVLTAPSGTPYVIPSMAEMKETAQKRAANDPSVIYKALTPAFERQLRDATAGQFKLSESERSEIAQVRERVMKKKPAAKAQRPSFLNPAKPATTTATPSTKTPTPPADRSGGMF